MKILVVGGGSGGHVTPVVAVASEILKKQADAKLVFWTVQNTTRMLKKQLLLKASKCL